MLSAMSSTTLSKHNWSFVLYGSRQQPTAANYPKEFPAVGILPDLHSTHLTLTLDVMGLMRGVSQPTLFHDWKRS